MWLLFPLRSIYFFLYTFFHSTSINLNSASFMCQKRTKQTVNLRAFVSQIYLWYRVVNYFWLTISVRCISDIVTLWFRVNGAVEYEWRITLLTLITVCIIMVNKSFVRTSFMVSVTWGTSFSWSDYKRPPLIKSMLCVGKLKEIRNRFIVRFLIQGLWHDVVVHDTQERGPKMRIYKTK